ncbi:MAG: hypothetical protein JSU63_10815 [Phycisphaerales bacterium]|nr:MAG: hypothetical protein JSU63_10815 [Phycisphaerales bacterium]
MRTFLGEVIAQAKTKPKYLICDKDKILWREDFKFWCRLKRICPRFGAVGQHGSIAVVERPIRALKGEATRRIAVPWREADFRKELTSFFAWYNKHGSHTTLHGKTPNEVYFRLRPVRHGQRR